MAGEGEEDGFGFCSANLEDAPDLGAIAVLLMEMLEDAAHGGRRRVGAID